MARRALRVVRLGEADAERVGGAGFEAGRSGRVPSWVNPYLAGTAYAEVWEMGWFEGRREWVEGRREVDLG